MLTRRKMCEWLAKTVGPRHITHCFSFPSGDEDMHEVVCEVNRMLACKADCIRCGLDERPRHGKTLARIRGKNADAAVRKYRRWLDQFKAAETARKAADDQ